MAAPEGYKTLGKIGISYKGDYTPNTVYERLDAVYHNGSTYLAIKDAPDGAPRDDKINWIYLAKGYDGETVDVADSEIAFADSETRENITSGEKVSTVFGKVKKFFADLTAPAFAQMITSKEDLLATKVTGYVPDAKAVADAVTEVNGKLDNKNNFIIKSSENEKLNADVVIIKHNKMIQIRFDGFKNLTLNTYNTLFVLPDEFKPVSGAFYDCSNPNGEIYRIVISSNGVVELFPYTNINLYNACNTFVYISN